MFFGGLTIAINGFSMVFDFSTIAFNGFRWFRTIGPTMRWFRWIVVVYNTQIAPTKGIPLPAPMMGKEPLVNLYISLTACDKKC